MKPILNILIILITLSSCGDNTNSLKNKKVEKVTPVKKEIKEAIHEQPISVFNFLDSTETIIIQQLDDSYTKTPYFTRVNNNLLFYVCNGDWNEKANIEESQKYPSWENLKFGIVNKQQEVVLPIEYNKIYNPDLTAKGYIEIEKDSRLGLFNYKTNEIIKCEFDVIFPSKNEAIAIGKIGSQYYNILKSGNTLIQDITQTPKYSKILKNHTFNALDSNTTYLMDSYCDYYESQDFFEGPGVVVTPSYLNALSILPEIQPNIVTLNGGFGVVESENEITKSSSFGEKITAFVSSFYEEGVDGRGYQLNQKRIITVNEDNELVSNQVMAEYYSYNEFYFCEKGNPSLIFINDTLIELKTMRIDSGDYPFYRTMPKYIYYSLSNNGEMIELNSNRFFDFTKYIKLNPSYFEGCFTQYTEENKEYHFGEIYLLEHLSINDLDIMRNEIFAEYGYIFKSERWNNYFGDKDWYSAERENVDDMLTETDKHNIDLILKVKEKLKTTEKQLINKTKIGFGMAG